MSVQAREVTGAIAKSLTRTKPTLPAIQLTELGRLFGVTLKELAPLLQISESTIHRLRQRDAFDSATAERAGLLHSIAQHGLQVYGGHEAALHGWLRHPLGELDGRTPLEALKTIAGLNLVDTVLGRIEHGIFF